MGGRRLELGMVGLGRMGSNLSRRLMAGGHRCVIYDVDRGASKRLEREGFPAARSLGELVGALSPPRIVWLMVPAGPPTEAAVRDVAGLLEPGDVVIDGGNSHYRDDVRRAHELAARGVRFLDCGTSGGVHGLHRGFCLTVGGDAEVFQHLEPIFASLAPGIDAARRTRGRAGEPVATEHGYLHCGSVGAGHFVKMIHNGIEYGVMEAYAEGLNLLRAAAGTPDHVANGLDLADVTEVWRRGSVIASWLLDLIAAALREDPDLASVEPVVADSGEGRWTGEAAIDLGVPAESLTLALFSRFRSRGGSAFSDRVLAAMRRAFGGHQGD